MTSVSINSQPILAPSGSYTTANGTTTLTISSGPANVFTGSANQTCKLPTTGIYAGKEYWISNQSSGTITVQSSGSNTIDTVAAGAGKSFRALKDTPTAAADWRAI